MAADPSPEPSPLAADPFGRALVEEATRKSGLIWVQGTGPRRALWHVWHDGAAYLVGDGPSEQPLPGLVDGGRATVTVRSKDKGGRLVEWTARITVETPGSASWQAAVAELGSKRLNAPDGTAMVERWARECRVLRLEPLAYRADFPPDPLTAPPPPTPATTRPPRSTATPGPPRRDPAPTATAPGTSGRGAGPADRRP